MIGDRQFGQVYKSFTDQFEPDGAGYVYRKGMKGAPVRVTAAEYDAFVQAFKRRIRWGIWSVVVATILLITAKVVLVPEAEDTSGDIAIWVITGVMVGAITVTTLWAWSAPARELARRPPVGAERSREEMRAVGFSRLTYGQLGMGAAAAVLLVASQAKDNDLFHGWGIGWLLLGGAVLAITAVQAFRKWRFERK